MTGRTFVACAAGLLVLGLAACGDDAESGEGGGDAASTSSTSTPDASSSGTGSDATSSGASTTASSSSGGVEPLPFIEHGRITVERGTSDLGEGGDLETGAFAGAYFHAAPDPTPAPWGSVFGAPAAWCPSELVGDCLVYSCFDGGDPWLGRVDRMGAGTVTVAGLTPPIVLVPTGDAAYSFDPDDVDWSDGDLITFSAEGDEVPAFSVDVIAPAHFTLDDPPTRDTVVDASQDLELSWSHDGVEGRVVLSVLGKDASDQSIEVVCEASPAEDRIMVPSAALSRVSGEALFLFSTTSSSEIDAGTVAVRAELRDYYSTLLVVE